jgi:hypothetical protein
MLALDTGWTPDMLAEMPASFREACHWTLYGRALVGPEGLPSGDVPVSAPPDVKLAALRVRKETAAIRAVLYPEDADV